MSNESSQSLDSPTNEAVMARLLELENRTGYRMQQCNGQRRYWNPNWTGPTPRRGSEVFVGKIPRDLFEDEIVPVFEKVGRIYELRLMMDFSGYNRGYAFVTFANKSDAIRAIELLDNFEIRPGLKIGVCKSVDNCKLFVGSIPKDKTKEEIRRAMSEITDDVSDVILYPGLNPGEFNRGFAFVEYTSHRAAAMARRKLIPGRITLFGYEVAVDWADPESDMAEMVKDEPTIGGRNVYVRNLKLSTSEFAVWSVFNALRPGCIEKVEKTCDQDYALVCFHRREDAFYAIKMMHGKIVDGNEIQVSLPNINICGKRAMNGNYSGNISGAHSVKSYQMDSNSNIVINEIQSAIRVGDVGASIGVPSAMKDLQVVNPKCTIRTYVGDDNSRSIRPQDVADLHIQRPIPEMTTTNCWKSTSSSANSSRKLRPATTMDHIANIKCPVTLLSELCSRLDLGSRNPQYTLLLEEGFGANGCKYVYQVRFGGSTYTPPVASSTIEEAKRISAQYVIDHIAPWLKSKLELAVTKPNDQNVLSYNNQSSVRSMQCTRPRNSGSYGEFPPE